MSSPMDLAIAEALEGRRTGGIPIGAVLECDGRLYRGHNRRVQDGNPILHGEVSALLAAGRLPAAAYRRSTMYATLSPCAMCSGAILLYGIPRVVIGENVTFVGEEELLRTRGVQLEIVQDERCIAMMEEFIRDNPELWHEDIAK